MKVLKQYAHALIIPIYGLIYLSIFAYLENSVTTDYHLIHCKLDDYIPFCEYFILPYMSWFLFISIVVFYFTFINQDKKEYYRLITVLGIGMSLFLLISWIYPNGQHLRPAVFPRDNFFTDWVAHLYRIDTPTNVLPSIHVYNSVAVCVAVLDSQALKRRHIIRAGTVILGTLIIFSTVFLKQHSFVDVLSAIVLNTVVCAIVYLHPLKSWAEQKKAFYDKQRQQT